MSTRDEGRRAWKGWRHRILEERRALKNVEDRLASPPRPLGAHLADVTDPDAAREQLESYAHLLRGLAETLNHIAGQIEQYRTEHFTE